MGGGGGDKNVKKHYTVQNTLYYGTLNTVEHYTLWNTVQYGTLYTRNTIHYEHDTVCLGQTALVTSQQYGLQGDVIFQSLVMLLINIVSPHQFTVHHSDALPNASLF